MGRISKVSKRRLTLLGSLCFLAVVYFMFSLVYNVYTICNLASEKRELENNLQELQEQAEDLKIDIEKLNDEKYLEDYAREHYQYSKDGEYILELGDDATKTAETIKTIDATLKSNYIIIISIIFLLIMVYIIGKRKSKKRRKK